MVASIIFLQIPRKAYVDVHANWLCFDLFANDTSREKDTIHLNAATDIYNRIKGKSGSLSRKQVLTGLIKLQAKKQLPSSLDRNYLGANAKKLVQELPEDVDMESFTRFLNEIPKALARPRHQLARNQSSSMSPTIADFIVDNDEDLDEEETDELNLVLLDVEQLIRAKLRQLRQVGFITGIPHWSPSEGIADTELELLEEVKELEGQAAVAGANGSIGKMPRASMTMPKIVRTDTTMSDATMQSEMAARRRSMTATDVVLVGNLWKRAVISGQNWKKRHFVLTEHFLTYYAKEDHSHAHEVTSNAKGEIKITSNTYCREMDDDERVVIPRSSPEARDKKFFGFMVITPSQTLRLAAESKRDRLNWMRSIARIVDQLRNDKTFLTADERELNSTFMVSFITRTEYVPEIQEGLERIGIGTHFGVIAVGQLGLAHAPKEMMAHKAHDESTSSHSKFRVERISRMRVENVIEQIKEGARMSFDYISLLCIASILAGVGLATNNTVVIVASMLVSPIMGPIMATTFGFVVHEHKLMVKGFRNEAKSLFLCFVIGVIIGFLVAFLDLDPDYMPTEELGSRGSASGLAIGLAIAIPSGVGVALSVLGANMASLVGVAISASLLPPAVGSGLMLTYDLMTKALGKTVDDDTLLQQAGISFCLTLLNIACIYVTAIVMFYLKQVAPVDKDEFWERDVKQNRDFVMRTKAAKKKMQTSDPRASITARTAEGIGIYEPVQESAEEDGSGRISLDRALSMDSHAHADVEKARREQSRRYADDEVDEEARQSLTAFNLSPRGSYSTSFHDYNRGTSSPSESDSPNTDKENGSGAADASQYTTPVAGDARRPSSA